MSSQTSFSFREEKRDPFSIIPLFSVSLIEFEISFPTRESFSLQKLFPLFLSQRKNQVLPPHFVVESERKIISIHARGTLIMSCLMHTQNQQTIQKRVSLVIYSAILSNAQQSLLFKNLSMMIMIRYDRLRDSTSKLPLVNCNKRIIYISIAHFTQSKFGCLPSQNRIRLEF